MRPRRLEMILSAVTSGLLVWSVVAGRIFQKEIGNRIAGSVIVLVTLIVISDLAMQLYRGFVRVRVPASLAR